VLVLCVRTQWFVLTRRIEFDVPYGCSFM